LINPTRINRQFVVFLITYTPDPDLNLQESWMIVR
jgi:hypothetical protein